jgi:hypothetical protein
MRLVLAGMVAVATAFAVVLGLGSWIRPKASDISDDLFGTIAAVAIAVLSALVMYLILKASPGGESVGRAAGIGRLFPKRRSSIAPSASRGPSAAQMAYQRDPQSTAVCVHLQPIEHAMKAAGLNVTLLELSDFSPAIKALCRINEHELRRVFALPEWIAYREGYEPERTPRDHPRADIFCSRCLPSMPSRADILVLHPDECANGTPWFPSPPSPDRLT